MNSNVIFSEYQRKYEIETGYICDKVLNFVEYYQETREIFTETLCIMMNTFKSIIKEENETRTARIKK